MNLLLRKKLQTMKQWKNLKQQIQKNQQKNKKFDNKGMTLVEVIVSMTLLTIVMVPVLQTITSSMYYNAKARNRQNVTLEAETIMETFKGYDLEKLEAMFDSAGIPGIDAASYEKPADMDADELIFNVRDMETENGKHYDVEIKATKTVKAVDILEPDNADEEKDAIFKGDMKYNEDARDLAVDDFVANHMTTFLTEYNYIDVRSGTLDEVKEADVEDMLSSTLILHEKETVYTISTDGSSNKAEAKILYRYYIKDFPYYGEDLDGDGELEDVDEEFSFSYPAEDGDSDGDYDTITSFIEVEVSLDSEDAVFYNLTTAANLEKVYIYFYPSYDDTESNEIIKIDNQTAIPLECYLLKQKIKGKTASFIHSKEVGYTPTVSCEGGSVKLLHNFKDDISDDTTMGMPSGVSELSFSEVIDYTDDARKNKVLVYDLEIKVFDNATGSTVTELKGTMIEKDKEYS